MKIEFVDNLYEKPMYVGHNDRKTVDYETNENFFIPFNEDEYKKIPFNGDGYCVTNRRHRDVWRVICIVCSDQFTLENVEETFDYSEYYKRFGSKVSFLFCTPAGVIGTLCIKSNKRRSKKFMDRMYKFAGRVRPQSKAMVIH